MRALLLLFVILETPVLFFQTASTLLLRRDPGPYPVQRLWALTFPLIFLGAVGLPLWALWRVLMLGR
jgi:hypothetical protein